jgi:hypothetical protein
MIYPSQEFAELLKKVIKDDLRHPLYDETVKHAEAMAVHIFGDKPVYLLERARPREDEEVKLYRLENYEPTTKAGADKAIDIVGKIFNPTLYSITWKEQNPQVKELQDYTLQYYPNYNSLATFDKDVVLRRMLADPNGVMAIKPMEVPENDSLRIEPETVLYGSSSIWYYDRDFFLIFKNKYSEDNIDYFEFDYFDKIKYVEMSCWYDSAKKTINIDEVTPPYVHGFKEIPAWFLRGKSKSLDNGSIIYESFFSSALPHWNLAVTHESDLLGAYINHLHPQKYELAEDCNYQFNFEGMYYPCRGGIVRYGNHDEKSRSMECPQCLGTGYSSVKSPHQSYMFNRKKLEDGTPSGLLPVGYITIPVDATKMLEERTREMIKKGMWAINMDVEDEVGENQSGIAKVIDRSAQYDTLFTISSVVFDVHLTNQYYFINKYMFSIEAKSLNRKEDKNLPEINKPSIFDVMTTAELINNFAVVQKAGMDKNYLRLKAIEIVNKDFSTAPDVRKYLIAILNLDPLYGFVQDEISLGVNSGVIRKLDWTIHENLKTFVDRAIVEKQGFLELEKDQQIPIIEGYGKQMLTEAKPKIDPAVMAVNDAA